MSKKNKINIKNINYIDSDPLRYVLKNNLIKEPGLWLEFGVWRGYTIDLISQYTDDNVYGFDTFSGVDIPWEGNINVKDMKGFDLGGKPPTSVIPLDPLIRAGKNVGKKRSFKSNVKFVTGLYENTLSLFLEKQKKNIAFIHIDCDVYKSTKTIFDNCNDYISSGCIIVFDELVNYPKYEMHELKAFNEYVAKNNINFEWIGINGKVLTDSEINEIGDYKNMSIEERNKVRDTIPTAVGLRII